MFTNYNEHSIETAKRSQMGEENSLGRLINQPACTMLRRVQDVLLECAPVEEGVYTVDTVITPQTVNSSVREGGEW